MTGLFTRTGKPVAFGSIGLRQDGFTLIELLTVCTILGVLLSIAVPMYQNSILRTKEAALQEDLFQMRDAIDKYYADTGEYPSSLMNMVEKRYIRAVPEDPFTKSSATWVTVDAEGVSGIFDIKSGSDLVGRNGIPYSEW